MLPQEMGSASKQQVKQAFFPFQLSVLVKIPIKQCLEFQAEYSKFIPS